MEEENAKNMKVVEIIKVLRGEYEGYRKTHEKTEVMEWIRNFKEKYIMYLKMLKFTMMQDK